MKRDDFIRWSKISNQVYKHIPYEEFKQINKPTKQYDLKNALSDIPITDAQGLQRAYSNDNSTYTYGDTLFVAGTKPKIRDVYDDISKVPFWGDVRNSERYQQALKALNANPNISKVVGHSLGASVALQLEKDYQDKVKFSRVYNAPVLDLNPMQKPERYRSYFDPVSILDRGATSTLSLNPFEQGKTLTHSYQPTAKQFQTADSTMAHGFVNSDKSISLVE